MTPDDPDLSDSRLTPYSQTRLTTGAFDTVLTELCAQFPHIPRATWQSRFARGLITDSDDRALAVDAPHQPGKLIRYRREVPHETPIPGREQILYRNERFLIVDKPHFLPTSPTGPWVRESLLARLVDVLDNPNLTPAHRLDRGTAGLMLFTTAPRWRDTYQTLFRTRSINKEYIALAAPLPELPPNYRRQTRLIRGNPFFRMEETPGVANSDTVITPLETDAAHWRYKLIPTTGRKHQLRVHMAALGAPILNDPWYPMLQSIQEDDFSRPLALLAYRLAFRDPVTGEQHVFDSDRVLRSPP